jgi:hypothetical protein
MLVEVGNQPKQDAALRVTLAAVDDDEVHRLLLRLRLFDQVQAEALGGGGLSRANRPDKEG